MSAPLALTASPRARGLHKRVLVASDSAILRAGMIGLLTDQPFSMVGTCQGVSELSIAVAATDADAVLMAPVNAMGAASLARWLANQALAAGLVLLLPPVSVRIHGEQFARAGRVHCLPLSTTPDRLVHTLHAACNGLARPVGAQRLSRGTGGRLTIRQQEVLSCLARGFSNNAIADRLEIKEETVKSHLTAIYRKLGVVSRTEAITAYLESR